MDAYEDEQQELHDRRQDERKALKRAKAEIGLLRATLEPLAGIALWSDAYPDCKVDHICDYNLSLYFSVEDVKAARKAIADERGEGG